MLGGPTLAALARFTLPSPCVRSLAWNGLGPEGGMALANALKKNTSLKTLVSAALPSAGGGLAAVAVRTMKSHTTLTELKCAQLGRPSNQGQRLAVLLGGPTLAALWPCVRSLMGNNLGHEGGMALSKALIVNSTLKKLWSAALPSNPPAHASRSFTARHASACVTPFHVHTPPVHPDPRLERDQPFPACPG